MVKLSLHIFDPESLNDQILLKSFYQGTFGALAIFDLSNKRTFNDSFFKNIIQIIKEHTQAELVLIGNKSDKITLEDSKIFSNDIKKFQEEYNILEFLETSAKTGENITNAFDLLIGQIIAKRFDNIQDLSFKEEEIILKIILIGLDGVGKTSIKNRYVGTSVHYARRPTYEIKEIEYYLEEPQEIEEDESILIIEEDKTEREEMLEIKDKDVIQEETKIPEEKINLLKEDVFVEKPTLPKIQKKIEPKKEEQLFRKKKKISESKKGKEIKKKEISISKDDKLISKEKEVSDIHIDSIEQAKAEDSISTRAKVFEVDFAASLSESVIETRIEKKLIRKATVFYKKRMNPMKLNKLTVFLSTSEIYEELKLEFEKIARAATGKALEIDEKESIVRVEPSFPGCVCVPSIGYLDAKKEYDHLNFIISPLSTGEIPDAKVNIYYKDELIDSIATPANIVNTKIAKISAIITIIIPVLGKLFDEVFSEFFEKVFPYYSNVGGLEGILTILTSIMLLVSGITYYLRKPKDAKPVESKSLSEIVSSITE